MGKSNKKLKTACNCIICNEPQKKDNTEKNKKSERSDDSDSQSSSWFPKARGGTLRVLRNAGKELIY